MTGEPTPFMDYWDAVDEAMLKLLALDTTDAAIEPDLIAAAQEEGWTPEEFVKAVPETLTADREREKFPVSLPVWLEKTIKAERLTLDAKKQKRE